MRALTIAEKRENELQRACKEYNIPYETGKHLMNRFYRLNADNERLLYLENDDRTCNRRSTKDLSESVNRRTEKLSADFEKFGLYLMYFGYLATICIKGSTATGIYDYYYDRNKEY